MTATVAVSNPTYSVGNDAIEMWIENHPDGHADSVVNLEWCISAALREELVQKQVVDPDILLVVMHDHKETGRYVVPLATEKWPIRFRYPNRNTVLAAAVWTDDDQAWNAKKIIQRHYDTWASWGTGDEIVSSRDPVLVDISQRRESALRSLDSLQNKVLHERSKLDGQSASLADDASDEDRQVFELEQQRADIDKQIAIIQGTWEESPEVDQELIDRLEAEVVALKADWDRLDAEYSERRQHSELVDEIIGRFQAEKGRSTQRAVRSRNTGELDVMVPEQMFAREPRKWQKYLGTKYSWPRPAIDQCQLRRRALFTLATIWPRAIGIALAGFFAGLLDLVIVTALLILGIRDIDFSVLRHPLHNHPLDLWPDRDTSSIWTTKKLSDGRLKQRSAVFYVLNPAVFFLIVVAGIVTWLASGSIIYLLYGLGLLIVLSALMALFGSVLVVPASYLSKRFWSWWDKRADKLHEQALQATKKDLTELTCGIAPQKSVGALPRRRRVAYIAHNVKAKVCKPFAG